MDQRKQKLINVVKMIRQTVKIQKTSMLLNATIKLSCHNSKGFTSNSVDDKLSGIIKFTFEYRRLRSVFK